MQEEFVEALASAIKRFFAKFGDTPKYVVYRFYKKRYETERWLCGDRICSLLAVCNVVLSDCYEDDAPCEWSDDVCICKYEVDELEEILEEGDVCDVDLSRLGIQVKVNPPVTNARTVLPESDDENNYIIF